MSRLLSTYLLTLTLVLPLVSQTSYYVSNTNGSDNNSGTSLGSPKRTIQGAINAAASGSVIIVINTGSPYGPDTVVVSKPLTFRTRDGRSHITKLKINTTEVLDTVRFEAGFDVTMLELASGRVEGADSLTIIANGKVIRRSPAGVLLQQLNYAGKVEIEYKGLEDMTSGFEIPAETSSTLYDIRISCDAGQPPPLVSLSQNIKPEMLYFGHGIIATGAFYVQLKQGTGTINQGFDRSGVTGLNKSHIMGNALKVTNGSINIFPVGSLAYYRPVELNSTLLAGVAITVSHVDSSAIGTVGLPIKDGISSGVDIARYPQFYWTVKPNVTISNIRYYMIFTAEGFTDFDHFSNIRILRRFGAARDGSTSWFRQEQDYQNAASSTGVPSVIVVNAVTSFLRDGVVFTYGLKAITTSVEHISHKIPEMLSLSQNYPNPFNPSTIIEFALPTREFVNLRIFDILGNEIETLVSEGLEPGTYRTSWNADRYAAGVYFYRLQAGRHIETRKLMLLK